jgi:DhnA family fructose-bisphosphate aldolase class Ia
MNHKQLCEPDFGKKENYTIILPIDQGVEHGPHAAFYSSDHPEMMDVNYQIDYIAELLHEGLVGATALPQRIANLLVKKYPHLTKNVIMKLNHGNNLNKDIEPSQAIFASSYSARNMGAVGYTIYPGSSKQDQMIDQFSMVRSHKPGGVKTVLWSYPRGGDFNPTSFETTLHAAYIAAQLEPDVIKVKLPDYDNMPTLCIRVDAVVKAACGLPVVFSGGAKRSEGALLMEAEAIAKNGGYGMIVGRNVFQRNPAEAKNLLRDIHKIFRES